MITIEEKDFIYAKFNQFFNGKFCSVDILGWREGNGEPVGSMYLKAVGQIPGKVDSALIFSGDVDRLLPCNGPDRRKGGSNRLPPCGVHCSNGATRLRPGKRKNQPPPVWGGYVPWKGINAHKCLISPLGFGT